MAAKSSETITWMHISDLHLRNSRAYDANIVLKALLRDVGERIAQDGLRPDFVAVTGDLAFTGKPAEYELVRQFLDELLRVTGLGKGRLFPVPGNHDVDRDLITRGAQAIGDGLTDRDGANDVLATPADRQLMMARFRGYRAFINDYLGGRLPFDDERYFYVHSLDLAGLRVAIMGLNSAWVSASVEDRAKGLLIGERQARAALAAADKAGAAIRIALLHHPLDWLREFDRDDSSTMLADGCHFILHGHLHHTAATQLTTPDGSATVLAGGACYETRQYANTCNWVQLNPATGNGLVILRRYSDARGGFWAKDTLTYRNAPDGVVRFRLPASLQGRVPPPSPPLGDQPVVKRTVPGDRKKGVSQRLMQIKIKFDRPMDPDGHGLKGPADGSFAVSNRTEYDYDRKTHTFTVTRDNAGQPLPPNKRLEFVINEAGGGAFKDEAGVPAREYRFSFTTGADVQEADRPPSGGRGQSPGPQTAGGPVRIDPANIPFAVIRELLMSAFTAEELVILCHDDPELKPAVNLFGMNAGLADMVQELLTFCEKRMLWDNLLTGVKRVRPNVYASFESRLYQPAQGARTPSRPAPSPAVLRQGLSRYDDVKLDEICMDNFPEVYDRFSRGMRRDEKINLLLDHCRRNPAELERLAELVSG